LCGYKLMMTEVSILKYGISFRQKYEKQTHILLFCELLLVKFHIYSPNNKLKMQTVFGHFTWWSDGLSVCKWAVFSLDNIWYNMSHTHTHAWDAHRWRNRTKFCHYFQRFPVKNEFNFSLTTLISVPLCVHQSALVVVLDHVTWDRSSKRSNNWVKERRLHFTWK